MKANLSSNTWTSVWDGKSTYTKRSAEDDGHGNLTYPVAVFRKYPCVEDSIKDHAGYLLGAMNGSKKRYEGLTNCKDYKSAITLIKAGGYATDTKYVSKICSIIERFGLDKYDGTTKVEEQTAVPVTEAKEYVVQAGAFKYKKNAKKRLSEVKKLGGDFKKAFITKSGENYVVQTGVFSVEGNARGMAAVLKASGIEACVKER